jgi:DsbC/DsbD-like thiol-disulfide interchange protein
MSKSVTIVPAMRLVTLLLLVAAPAAAQPVALATAPSASPGVSLIEGWRQPDGNRVAAIAIRLDPGWHTYWRVPGEAGIPPSFDWSGSENLADVRYEWPRPTVFDSYGMQTYGYADTLVLPVRLAPRDPAQPINVALDFTYGVCNDICVPAEAHVTARISADAPPVGRDVIEASLAERVRDGSEAGISRMTCGLVPAADGYRLTAEIAFAGAPARPQAVVFESGQPGLWIGEAETHAEGRTIVAEAPVAGAGNAGPVLERRGLRMTLLDADRAIEVNGCQAPG